MVDIPTTKANLINIRGISFVCPNCNRKVSMPYKGECKKPPYHYWIHCPQCEAVVDITF